MNLLLAILRDTPAFNCGDFAAIKNQAGLNEIAITQMRSFPLLSGAATVSHARMEQKLEPLYLNFDQRRKTEEARAADAQDAADLKALENTIKNRSKS